MPDRGPLSGIRIIEMVGIGPAPFAAMMLADLGAEVVRIARPGPSDTGIRRPPRFDLVARGKRTLTLDLKKPEAVACLLDLVETSDALIEGFRPGVMEKLGLGPDVCLQRNPRFVFGRVTGWGQDGPAAKTAGHDVNYLALAGMLDMIGHEGERPVPPLNIIADYAGGSMMLIAGLLSALLHASRTGEGQVVDAAMVDGVALLGTAMTGLRAAGMHNGPRGTNILDGGAPYYDVYACADGRHLALGAIEPKFQAVLLSGLGFDPATFPDLSDKANWPEGRRRIAARIAERSRDEWAAVFADGDACASPVLAHEEAASHPHNAARANHVEIAGVRQPAPAPRFSKTVPPLPEPPECEASDGDVLRSLGFDEKRIANLIETGAVGAR